MTQEEKFYKIEKFDLVFILFTPVSSVVPGFFDNIDWYIMSQISSIHFPHIG